MNNHETASNTNSENTSSFNSLENMPTFEEHLNKKDAEVLPKATKMNFEDDNSFYTLDAEYDTKNKHHSATLEIKSKNDGKETIYRYDSNPETEKKSLSVTEDSMVTKRFTKTHSGTIIDIYKNGQPDNTYAYDEDGKPLMPLPELASAKLPEDYIENQVKNVLPENAKKFFFPELSEN